MRLLLTGSRSLRAQHCSSPFLSFFSLSLRYYILCDVIIFRTTRRKIGDISETDKLISLDRWDSVRTSVCMSDESLNVPPIKREAEMSPKASCRFSPGWSSVSDGRVATFFFIFQWVSHRMSISYPSISNRRMFISFLSFFNPCSTSVDYSRL